MWGLHEPECVDLPKPKRRYRSNNTPVAEEETCKCENGKSDRMCDPSEA